MRNILIAVPMYTSIHEATIQSVMTIAHSRDYTADTLILRGGDEHIHNPKVRIAWKYNNARDIFLRGNYDYMLTVEQDIIFRHNALSMMLDAVIEHGAGVGYGLYCYRQAPHYRWSLFPSMDERTYTGQSLSHSPERAARAWGKVIEVCGQGNGFTLVRRDVLERIRYRTEQRVAHGVSSQDTYFSFDAMRMGIKQIGHLGVICGHIDYQNGRFVTLWPALNEQMHRIEEYT